MRNQRANEQYCPQGERQRRGAWIWVLVLAVAAVLAVAGMRLPVRAAAFSDVPEGAWYAEPVDWAVESGITSGTGENTFSPYASCTRAQAVTLLWRAEGGETDLEGMEAPQAFSDVPADAWYAAAVRWASARGITSGTGGGSFSPYAPCTRAQIVTMLRNQYGGYAVYERAAFADVSPSSWYADAVSWAYQTGITSGTGNGRFSPAAVCTRAQIVSMLYRQQRDVSLLQVLREEGTDEELPVSLCRADGSRICSAVSKAPLPAGRYLLLVGGEDIPLDLPALGQINVLIEGGRAAEIDVMYADGTVSEIIR